MSYVPVEKVDPTDCLYLPHFPNEKAEEYSLLYAPSNVYIFLTFFHAIYERIIMAQDLIKDKINHDISEMTPDE